MKKADVKVGQLYAVKVSGNVVPVVLDEEHPKGGWVGTNQETNRQVRIKSAQRLRCSWNDYLKYGDGDEEASQAENEAPTHNRMAHVEKKTASESKGTKAEKKATGANTGRQGEKRGMSGLDAAAKVLAEADEPLSCKAIVERAFGNGYWRSEGKTPAATIYAAILREIQRKGEEARFRKAARGKFELAR